MMARWVAAGLAAAVALGAGEAAAQAFSRADANHDGFVTFEEARTVMPGLSQVHFNQCDLDRDGRLNLGQWNCLQGLYRAIYRDR